LLFSIFALNPQFATATSVTDTRELSIKPKEIYGAENAPIIVRIGNGGAGPTGVLRVLAEDYISTYKTPATIAWYQDISPNTLRNLKRGTIDIALVYEKKQGDEAIKEGWATNYTPIFNDHFIIIGPKTNPANLLESDKAEQAFAKISQAGIDQAKQMFLSRDDNSGTNVKEQGIWQMSNLEPWAQNTNWYVKSHVFPKDALIQADKESLYTITDWATWVSNSKALKNSKIFIRGGKILLNPFFALLGKEPNRETLKFLDYLKSPRGQKIIADFGRKLDTGLPLFTPAAQEEFIPFQYL